MYMPWHAALAAAARQQGLAMLPSRDRPFINQRLHLIGHAAQTILTYFPSWNANLSPSSQDRDGGKPMPTPKTSPT
jgi:hypothetical protein